MNSPRHIVLFIVTAPYTCEYVSEMFFRRFLLAKYKELTSSDALEANGVRTKDAKNGDGKPMALLNELTAPTMGSAKRVTMAMPIARKSIAFLTICDFVIGVSSSLSASLSSSSASMSSRSGVDPSRGSRPACAGPPPAVVRSWTLRSIDERLELACDRTEMFFACSSTQCVMPAQNSAREISPSPSLSNSLSHTSTSPSVTSVSCIVTLIATSASLSSWTSTSLLPSESNCPNILSSAAALTSPFTRMPPIELPRCAANMAPRFLADLACAASILRR